MIARGTKVIALATIQRADGMGRLRVGQEATVIDIYGHVTTWVQLEWEPVDKRVDGIVG